jgi:hypothetical protein
MLDSTLLVNTVNKILSNSGYIQELELYRLANINQPIIIFDFHDIFIYTWVLCIAIITFSAINLVITFIFDINYIFPTLITLMEYSISCLLGSFILYEIICYFANGQQSDKRPHAIDFIVNLNK